MSEAAQRPDQLYITFTLHQGQGTPGTRPGITEIAPNLNGRWNRAKQKMVKGYLSKSFIVIAYKHATTRHALEKAF
eukprot:1160800-Pelagomonas_calceolata.AAC.5